MVWYENDVKKLEALQGTLTYNAETIFYGSSSIRLWTTLYDDFFPWRPVNLGFGGATLAACVWFFDRIMKPYAPRHIVCYAGDNDLGDGRTAEEVFLFFKQLLCEIEHHSPGVPVTFISIKPSISRWNLAHGIRYANQLIQKEMEARGGKYYFVNIFDRMLDANGHPIRELFDADGLHLSPKGYALWKEVLLQHLQTNFNIS
jgi:lysophospholipase L1-like esterase